MAAALSAFDRAAAMLPAWAVPRKAWPTLLARSAAGSPRARHTPRQLVAAAYSGSASEPALAELAGVSVPRALRPFVLAAAIAAGDADAARRATAGLRDATVLNTAAGAAIEGSWKSAVAASGGVPRDFVERWIVAANAAGRLTEAVAMGAAIGGRPPRDARRALAEAADGLAMLGGSLEALTYRASAEATRSRPQAVLYVAAQSRPHRNGGYASRTHGLVTALAAAGRDVRVLTRLGFPRDTWPRSRRKDRVAPVDVIDGIEYHRAGDGPSRVPLEPYAIEFARVVEAHARAHGAALIHSASFPSTALSAALAANALGLPFVYEVRALESLYRTSALPAYAGTEGEAALLAAELAVCARADAILVITAAIADELALAGVPRDRITVVGNAVDPDAFVPVGADPALASGLGLEGRTVIGYAGAMLYYEGLDLLADALDELAAMRDDFALLALGDGPERAGLAARAATSRYPLILPGRLPHDEVARHLALADICPFPRRSLPITEAVSPMKPFEAMALGKAVVVSDVAALREIVAEGRTGRVVSSGDARALAAAIGELLDRPAERSALGAAAREWVLAEATWPARAAIVEGVYASVLGSVSS